MLSYHKCTHIDTHEAPPWDFTTKRNCPRFQFRRGTQRATKKRNSGDALLIFSLGSGFLRFEFSIQELFLFFNECNIGDCLSSGAFFILTEPGFGQVIMHWLSFDCQAIQCNCVQIFLYDKRGVTWTSLV